MLRIIIKIEPWEILSSLIRVCANIGVMTIRKYYKLALARWNYRRKTMIIDILKQKKILFGVMIAVVIIGAFTFIRLFIYDSYRIPDGGSSMAIVSGSITGLPPFTGEKDVRIAFLSIINPETAVIESIQERQGEVTTYQVESSPGLKMVIVRFFDLESGAYYFGASKIVRTSPGESNAANVDMQEQRVNGDAALLFLIPYAFAAETSAADGAKPIVAVVGNDGFANAWVEQELAKKGFELIGLDEKMAKATDLEYDLQRRGLIDPAYHITPTRQDPNFIVNVDVEVEKRPIYRNRPETYDTTTVKVTFIDVTTGQIVAQKSSTETFKVPHEFSREVAKEFIGRVGGTGPDAIEIPPFTPSEVEPLTESAVSYSERFRKIAEEAMGGVGGKEKDQPPPPPKSSCNIPAFQGCANTFSLQGCIDACPYVSAACPAGTSPDTECKETDKACSDSCWNKADAHLDSCLASNNCTKEEVTSGGGGAQR